MARLGFAAAVGVEARAEMFAGGFPSPKKIQSFFTFAEILNDEIKFLFVNWTLKLREEIQFVYFKMNVIKLITVGTLEH